VLFALARALAAKSPFPRGNTERVVGRASALGKSLGHAEPDLDALASGPFCRASAKLEFRTTFCISRGR
jgi:hypothetical protein